MATWTSRWSTASRSDPPVEGGRLPTGGGLPLFSAPVPAGADRLGPTENAPNGGRRSVQHRANRLRGAGDHGRPVVRGDDRPLEELGVSGEGRDPLLPGRFVPLPVLQPELLGLGLVEPGDVPGLQAEPPEHLLDLLLGRWFLEVPADAIARAS